MTDWKTWISILTIVCLTEYLGQTESTITFVAPVNGTGTATEYVAEGSTSGTVYTVSSTSDDVSVYVIYNMTSQSVAGTFEMASDTDGVITVAGSASIDYETRTEHVLVIEAIDDSTTSTATVTVRISDVNDNTPAFSESSYLFTVADGTRAGGSVGTVSATDGDGSAPNNVIVFTMGDGSGNTTFKVDRSTGAITVATGMTLNRATMASFSMSITGADSGTSPMSSESTVTIGICASTSGAFVASYSFGLAMMCAILAICREKNL